MTTFLAIIGGSLAGLLVFGLLGWTLGDAIGRRLTREQAVCLCRSVLVGIQGFAASLALLGAVLSPTLPAVLVAFGAITLLCCAMAGE